MESKSPVKGLRTTIYKVNELEAAKLWYTKAFVTEPYFNEPFYIGFNIAGYELGLIPDEQPGATKTDNVITYWGVDDIETEYQRLLNIGATVCEEPTNAGGEIVVAAIKDPWGNAIGLIYNPEFSLD